MEINIDEFNQKWSVFYQNTPKDIGIKKNYLLFDKTKSYHVTDDDYVDEQLRKIFHNDLYQKVQETQKRILEK